MTYMYITPFILRYPKNSVQTIQPVTALLQSDTSMTLAKPAGLQRLPAWVKWDPSCPAQGDGELKGKQKLFPKAHRISVLKQPLDHLTFCITQDIKFHLHMSEMN